MATERKTLLAHCGRHINHFPDHHKNSNFCVTSWSSLTFQSVVTLGKSHANVMLKTQVGCLLSQQCRTNKWKIIQPRKREVTIGSLISR